MMPHVPQWMRSIRVRLTLLYSVALFVVGALVLAGIYLGLSRALDDEPITRTVIAQGLSPQADGSVAFFQQSFEVQLQSVESLANERALEQLRTWSFGALGATFLISLVVGWFVAGRVVRPIGRISDVARDIQATDLSRRIALEGPDDELTRLAHTFDDMIGRLDGAFESQRRFVHEASHELRNPLATIRTNLEVALADPDATSDDLRQTAEVVERSTERMGRVVDDLLSFARREIPEREVTRVDLRALIDEVCEEFAGSAEANVVTVKANGVTRKYVRGDASALRRVVANLLANAIEHSPSGKAIDVSVKDTEFGVQLRVEDRGPGVARGDQKRVFERGWRSERVRARRPVGSGLGLTIVRQVVQEHDGKVTVESANPGSSFVVDLPARL